MTNGSAVADLKGTLALVGGGGAAHVSNTQPLWIDGGLLISTGTAGAPGNTISGNVSVYNNGTMTVNVTDPTAPTDLTLTAGVVTVGAQAPSLSNTGGTLNLNTGATLSSGNLVVQGGPAPAVVNMFGATINSALDLEGGVLNTADGSIGPTLFTDGITGSFTNAGTVQFAGALHGLAVGGNYTQTSAGTLDIRLANGTLPPPPGSIAPSDGLGVGGTATLDGTLNLTGSVAAGQTWVIVTAGPAGAINTVSGSFATVNFPDDVNPWQAFVPPGNNQVDVTD